MELPKRTNFTGLSLDDSDILDEKLKARKQQHPSVMGRQKNTASFWTRIPPCEIQNADIPIQMASSHFLGIQSTTRECKLSNL